MKFRAVVLCLATVLAAISARAQDAPEPGSAESLQVIRGLLRDGLEEAAAAQMEGFLKRFPESPDAPELLYQRGRILLAHGKAEEASGSLEALIRRHPESAYIGEAYYLLGVAEETRGRAERALELFRKVLSMKDVSDAMRKEARLHAAHILRQQARCQEALDILKDVKDSEAAMARGWCQYDMQNFDTAENEFKNAGSLALAPAENRALRKALAMMAYHRKRYAEAEDMLKTLFEEDASPDVRTALAWCLYQMDDAASAYDVMHFGAPGLDLGVRDSLMLEVRRASARGDTGEAVQVLQKILETNPQDTQALVLHGRWLREKGDVAGALGSLTKASRLLPHGEAQAVLFDIGEIHYNEQRDYVSALRVFSALADDPASPVHGEALLYAAKSSLGLGERPAALEHLTALLEGNPAAGQKDEAYALLTEIYVALGDYATALKFAKLHLDEFPGSARAPRMLLRRADLEERLDDTASAVQSLRYYLTRFTGEKEYGEVRRQLAGLLFESGKYAEAADLWQQIAREAPEDTHAVLQHGRCLLEQGDKLEQAGEVFLSIQEEAPVSANYWAAQAAKQRKDGKAALLFYQKAVQAAAVKGSEEDLVAEALREGAALALQNGAEAQALEYYRNLRRKGDIDARYAQYAIERYFLSQGKIKEALLEIPMFTDGNPADALDAEKMLERTKARYERGEAKAEDFRKIADHFPKASAGAEARFYLARMEGDAGRGSEARQNLEMALEAGLPPDLAAQAQYHLGILAFKRKDYAGALTPFRYAVESGAFSGQSFTLHYLLAQCFENLARHEEAAQHFAAFFDLLPDKTSMLEEQIHAALFFQRNGKWKDSIMMCVSLLKAELGDDIRAEVQFYLAENLKLMERYDEALVEYLKVTYLHPKEEMWAVTARFEAAKIYEAQGRWDEAAKLYALIAQAAPGSVQSETARERLETANRAKDASLLKEQVIQ